MRWLGPNVFEHFFFRSALFFKVFCHKAYAFGYAPCIQRWKKRKKTKTKRNMFLFNTNNLISLFLWIGGESGVLYLHWYCKKNYQGLIYIYLLMVRVILIFQEKKNIFRWQCSKYNFFFEKESSYIPNIHSISCSLYQTT